MNNNDSMGDQYNYCYSTAYPITMPPAIGTHLVIAKVPYFPPIPVAKIQYDPTTKCDKLDEAKQKYGEQHIKIVSLDNIEIQSCGAKKIPNYEIKVSVDGLNKVRYISNSCHCPSYDSYYISDCIVGIIPLYSYPPYAFNNCTFANCRFWLEDGYYDGRKIFNNCTFIGDTYLINDELIDDPCFNTSRDHYYPSVTETEFEEILIDSGDREA